MSILGQPDGSLNYMQLRQQTTQKKKYQTRNVSTANKVNLKLENAINPLIQGLAKSVAGIF